MRSKGGGGHDRVRGYASQCGRRIIAVEVEFLERALELAERGRGATHPNPVVGAVVVAGDEVVGEGWHERKGGPHAEVIALDAAGDRARGATLYVTLEPCAHHGATPPCVDALRAAGVARVVVGQLDPHPAHRGGLESLRRAGRSQSWPARPSLNLAAWLASWRQTELARSGDRNQLVIAEQSVPSFASQPLPRCATRGRGRRAGRPAGRGLGARPATRRCVWPGARGRSRGPSPAAGGPRPPRGGGGPRGPPPAGAGGAPAAAAAGGPEGGRTTGPRRAPRRNDSKGASSGITRTLSAPRDRPPGESGHR